MPSPSLHPDNRDRRSVRAAVLTGAAALSVLLGGAGALAIETGSSKDAGRLVAARDAQGGDGRECPWRDGGTAATLLRFDVAAQPSRQTSPAPAAGDLSVADVADRVNPAVVTVTNLSDAFGDESTAVGAGSGFIVDAEGHVVTNDHVVEGATELTVELFDGTRLPATVVGRDSVADIAVLQLDLSDGGEIPETVDFGDSDAVRAGERVVAIGSSLGELTNTVSDGTVGAVDRDFSSYTDLIQHDAEIYPGNSGGPLLNLRGEVVGVNVAGDGGGQTATIAPARIGFALDGNAVQEVVAELIENGSIPRPFLGIQGAPGEEGHEILAIDPPDGPSAEAGLEVGDVITAIDDEAIGGRTSLPEVLYEREPGETVVLTVDRDGAEQEIEVVLGDRTAATE